MDFTEYQSALNRDGFVVVRQLLPAAELAELQRELERYIGEVAPKLGSDCAFYDNPQRLATLKQLHHLEQDAYFSAYREHPTWTALARALVGEEVNPLAPEWFNKPPGTGHITPPHQDNYYFCLAPPRVVTIWMALDAVDDENGCLRYVAGSHQRGIRPHGRSQVLGFSQGILDYTDEDRASEVPIHLQPGDVVAHHGNTIHRADANRSPARHRRAFAIVFRGASCQRDEAAFARYQAALQQQREQLGLPS
jgi:phytanoyl-CoA hydroxylase